MLLGLLADTWAELGVGFAALACLTLGLFWHAGRRLTFERHVRLRGTPSQVRSTVEETVARTLRARGTGKPSDDRFSIAVWSDATGGPHELLFDLQPDGAAVEVRIRSAGVIFNPALPGVDFNRNVVRARLDALERVTAALVTHPAAV